MLNIVELQYRVTVSATGTVVSALLSLVGPAHQLLLPLAALMCFEQINLIDVIFVQKLKGVKTFAVPTFPVISNDI